MTDLYLKGLREIAAMVDADPPEDHSNNATSEDCPRCIWNRRRQTFREAFTPEVVLELIDRVISRA